MTEKLLTGTLSLNTANQPTILVKEGRVEVTFLFHSNCLKYRSAVPIKNHDSIHIKNI